MARFHREMTALMRNNAEKQKLEKTLTDLDVKQVKRKMSTSHQIRLVQKDLITCRKNSGSGLLASEVVKDSTMEPSIGGGTRSKNSKTIETAQETSSAEEDNRSRIITAFYELDRSEVIAWADGKQRVRAQSVIGLQRFETPAKGLHRSHTALGPRSSLTNDDLIGERRRSSMKVVRRVSESESLYTANKPGFQIKPEERYKYDGLILHRQMLLQKSLPANWISASSYQLNPALSASGRKTALHSLIEINNAKQRAQGKDNYQQQLQNRISKFLETL